MEFLSGYASARAPLSAYQVEPRPSSQRANRPTRSNSTSGTTTASKKRSRIPGHGHVRTSSASTTSSSRTETPSSPHTFAWLQPPPSETTTTTTTISGPDSAVASATEYPAAGPVSLPRRDHAQQRDRMPAAGKYYQNKQLPATPRLDTHEAASKYLSTGSASEPASARTPASATTATSSILTPTTSFNLSSTTATTSRGPQQHAAMFPELAGSAKAFTINAPFPRAESVSSISGAATINSSRTTMLSSEPPSSAELAAQQSRPFVVRNGRTFISDPTLPYPLPVDLEELHRQSLRTLLLMQLFDGPICSPAFADKPPTRVLEIGCGCGFWSMMCHRHYERQGHTNISFTGLDIAPIAPGAGGPGASGIGNNPGDRSSAASVMTTTTTDGPPDDGMKWRFVQHDLRRLPLPFRDEEFDFVMVKNMSLATTMAMQQALIDEYLRILSPGGTIEIWESDHTLRMLRPHVPETTAAPAAPEETDSDASSSEDKPNHTSDLGAYVMTANTPLSAPLNNYLVEYNGWLSKVLERLSLNPVPCAQIGPMLLQETESLTTVENRRLAVPLSEVRWEREGVGGVVTKDGKSYISRVKDNAAPVVGALDPGAAALRRTALLTVVQMIQSMEHVLREVSGKSQDEWDGWLGKAMNNLVKENGTSWGECLEVGAWWAKKRTSS